MENSQEIQEEIDRLYHLCQTTLSGRYANITRINELTAQLELIKANANKPVRMLGQDAIVKSVVNSMITNGYTIEEYMERNNWNFSDYERKCIQDAFDSLEAMSPNQVFDVAHHMFVTGTKLENDILVWGYTATKLDRKNILDMYNKMVLDQISDLLVGGNTQEAKMKRVKTLVSKLIVV